MAVADTYGAGGESVDPKPKPTVNELLGAVSKDLATSEAKKLGQLKAALEAIDKKKQVLVDDYAKQFNTLRDLWCSQEIDIVQLAKLAPWPDAWQTVVKEKICPDLTALDAAKTSLLARQDTFLSPLELAREQARRALAVTEAALDAVNGNAQRVREQLTLNSQLLPKISPILKGSTPAVAVYLFWFKLLPSHRALKPYNVKEGDYGTGITPAELCSASAGGGGHTNYGGGGGSAAPQRAPWLMDPNTYASALDDAWANYKNAKYELAAKEGDYQDERDEIARLEKQLVELTKTLDARITAKLETIKPKDLCPSTVSGS